MANRLSANPIYFDQFDADVTLVDRDYPLIVKKIVLLSAADGDIFRLEDLDGNRLLHMVQTGNADTVEIDFGDEGFDFGKSKNGVAIDVSDCTGMTGTNGTDAVWLYLV